jgi:hypothetical protein
LRDWIAPRKLRLGAATVVALATSCSLVHDLSPDQCGKDSECRKFGSNFQCDEGICVDHSPMNTGGRAGAGSGGKGEDGGRGGSGGSGATGGSGVTGGSGNETSGGSDTGGSMAGGTGGDGGTSGGAGEGGDGGTGPVIECESHDDCFVLHGDGEPWGCIDAQCKALTTAECPAIMPFDDANYDALRSTDAIIIGAFSRINTALINPQTQNFDLALSQIARETGGIPALGDTHRQVVAVVCGSVYATQRDLLTPVDHLITDLRVPAILATLDTADQQYVFEERARDAGVFMMVPNSSDDAIVNLDDGGLVYHMLAGPDSLSVTYQPLIDRTIAHLQNQDKLGAGPDYDDVRIALVTTTDDRFLNDLGGNFEDLVLWNGKSAGDNADAVPATFLSVGTRSEPPDYDQTDVTNAILAFAPHIIVAATDAEMTRNIMPILERKWNEDAARQAQGGPFYILSPFNYGGPKNTLLRDHPSVRQRLLGINWPATLGSETYEAYKSSYLQAYPGGVNYNLENFYDSVYFLLYGMVAAGPQINGQSIANGMPRITSRTGQPYDVGTDELAEAFDFLAARLTNRINLTGSNGRPEWNAGGGRVAPASVWCIDQGTGSSGSLYVPDVLVYNEASKMLSGTVPATCFTFPAP